MTSKYEAFQRRLKTDRIWFMRNFLKIRDKKSKLVPFEPNSAQLKFNSIIDEDTNLTTLSVASFNSNIESYIESNIPAYLNDKYTFIKNKINQV